MFFEYLLKTYGTNESIFVSVLNSVEEIMSNECLIDGDFIVQDYPFEL